jgi:hypothetical protein
VNRAAVTPRLRVVVRRSQSRLRRSAVQSRTGSPARSPRARSRSFNRRRERHHSGIVDEHVDRSELRLCEGNERLHVVAVRDVEGLAKALHSGDPAFDALPAYFKQRLEPALRALLKSAASAGQVRPDIAAEELLSAVASLSMHAFGQGPKRARRMVSLLVDGLRYGASSPPTSKKAARRKT